ncbi:MAG: MuA-transposase/repressor protein DNA-binding [Rhodocyclales bacterium]|nr:MuA-transposase/repressor protein DNA-binding [Rhodocyclales bacterium]
MTQVTLTQIAEAVGMSKRAIEQRASNEAWIFEERPVRGGRQRFFAPTELPKDVRDSLLRHHVEQTGVTSSCRYLAPTGKVTVPQSEADLTDSQRAERDARMFVLSAIARYQSQTRCSQEAAMGALLIWAKSGQADEVTVRVLRLARDTRGRKGDGFPSVRTLKRWLSAKKVGDLAPRVTRPDMTPPPWSKAFLAAYQQPQKPSVEDCYRTFALSYQGELPSIHQVRRFLGKVGTVTREAGRMGPRELKNLMPFVRRDFSDLEPNDVWTADGHTFDAEVQHPDHGRPFRPEITVFMDVATRRVVGWSINLAESSWAVADALRSGVEQHGVPALIYVDNGSGYRNAMMADTATGMVGRIGSTMTHSLPYNSQAKGVIERFWGSTMVPAAKALPSYIGATMDRQARLENFKVSRKAIKYGGVMPIIPFAVFRDYLQEHISAYNTRAHRSLGKVSPDLCWANFEAKGWQAERMQPAELDTLFRPRMQRTVARGEVVISNNIYFSSTLLEFHGEKVHVAYDIHNVQKVWVFTLEGRLITTADVNGNRKSYFPKAVVEQAREKRAEGRLARIEVKREEIFAELHGTQIDASAGEQVVIAGRVMNIDALPAAQAVIQAAEEVPADIPRIRSAKPTPVLSRSEKSTEENYADWLALDTRIASGETVSEADARWHRTYQQTAQFRAHVKKIAAHRAA